MGSDMGFIEAMKSFLERILTGAVVFAEKDADPNVGGGVDRAKIPEVGMEEAAPIILQGDFVKLVEKSVRVDGTVPIKLIQPGWGSSAYYAPSVLERDGPKAFPAGTKMFWNHATESEERERPERDLNDLAAVLQTPARYDPRGPDGAGLYADAKVFEHYRSPVGEMAQDIGVSIVAEGIASPGEIEGRKGPILEAIEKGHSIDFVTYPGAGGKVLQLFESVRTRKPNEEVSEVDEKEAQALREANQSLEGKIAEQATEIARLKETALLSEARTFVAEVLAKVDMPEMTRARLAETLAKVPVVAEGALDKTTYQQAIEEAAKAEVAYIASVTGSGQIKGMGNSGGGDTGNTLKESFKAMYRKQGKSAEEAERLAALAAA